MTTFDFAPGHFDETLQGHVRTVYRHVDALMAHVSDDAKRRGTPIQCKKGCAACCNQSVTLHLPEALVIVLGLMQTEAGRDTIARLIPVWHQHALELHNPKMDCHAWLKMQRPCTFLQNNLCSIYPMRPSSCRKHVVVSDPGLCAVPGAPVQSAQVNKHIANIVIAPMTEMMNQIRVPNLVGPLEFTCLMAVFLAKEGVDAFTARIRNTHFEYQETALIPWVHLDKNEKNYDKEMADIEAMVQAMNVAKPRRSPMTVLPSTPPKWRGRDLEDLS